GLATELERRGYDLHDALWSARILLEEPEAIAQVHRDYLWAGADVLISASYQATVPGFMARGLSEAEAVALLQSAVRLAQGVRDDFWADEGRRHGRVHPLVAASIGPYGAYLADGSEYTGIYDLDEAGLYDFHRRRWQLLVETEPDLLACETIPALPEARALAQLLAETPDMSAWFSFACRNGREISDGTPLAEVVSYLTNLEAIQGRVAAVGINCTAPQFIPSLIRELEAVTAVPIVVYPNSGEEYDPVAKTWRGQSVAEEYGTSGREWRKLGAALIGGCCRTRPAHIRALSDRLKRRGDNHES
ncbi:MAG: homocysteine S-methyltransferase, partial [Anaerolineales bacterium]|nr:homocysteine S-methyltransferase [Anaerolineales bacterium]